MPKKVFAVTNVKISNEPDGFFPAGSEFDVSKVSREQALALHEAGAIEVRVVDEPAPAQTEETQENKSETDNPPTENLEGGSQP